jgi:O-Antigen ligase
MLNFLVDLLPTSNSEDYKLTQLGPLSATEKIIYWAIVLTPLWWLLGIQTLFFPFLLAGLFVFHFDLDKLKKGNIPASIWAWLAMSFAMLLTATMGLYSIGFPTLIAAAAVVTFLKSYFMIFAAMVLPFLQRIRLRVITRAVVWLSIGYIVTTIILLLMLFLKLNPPVLVDGSMPSLMPPLARIIPGDKQAIQIILADIQGFFGIPFPRVVLYTADPPILGVCAVFGLLICLGEPDRRLKRWSVVGSSLALFLCFSRIAWIALPCLFLVVACFRKRSIGLSSLWTGSIICLISASIGLTVVELIEKPMEVFTSARAESSRDRALVVGKTIEAWLEYPWFGWGVIRGSVRWYIYDISLGSFSTYSAILYLHGVFGFAIFVAALLLTLWDLWKTAKLGSITAQRGFAAMIALCLMCNATPLSWMAVYFWYFFMWIGAILYRGCSQKHSPSEWEQLATG